MARAPLIGNLHHEAILRGGFRVDDLDLRNERTEPQGFEVELDDGEEVLVVVAVSVAVEVGGVLMPVVVRQLVSAKLVGNAVRARAQGHNFRAPRVHG